MTRTAIYSLQDNALTKETGEKVCCHESARSLWKDGQKVEEGKDYEVKNIGCINMAFPLPVKGMTTNDWMKVSDESPPASAVEEADKLYPEVPESVNRKQNATLNDLRSMQRQAHITCARMYTGEIEKGRGAIDILKALCALKKHKDTVGKDEYYEKAQPEVWEIANKFFDKLEK